MSRRKARHERRNRVAFEASTDRLWLSECQNCGAVAVAGLYRDMEAMADRLGLDFPSNALAVIVAQGWALSEITMQACPACSSYVAAHGIRLLRL